MKLMNLRNILNATTLAGAMIFTTAALAAPAVQSATLPQRISAAELKRMLLDQPGMFEIVDVRPSAPYADFSLPGSINASIADVIANPAYLKGAVPLIIVDRDGSLAMAVGGILSQKTQRSIRVLFGGLEAYWSDSAALQPPAAPASVQPVKPAASVPANAKPAAPASAPAGNAAPAKKSAGC
ncbi:MAG: rhodanese-like domain-containing protein [Betaproteobacteria bacterium]